MKRAAAKRARPRRLRGGVVVAHGVDLVEVPRIARMLREHGKVFLERCFTPAERAYKKSSKNYAQHIAARFAAKEAVMKALGTGLSDGISWTEIGVETLGSGQPVLKLEGRAKKVAAAMGVASWLISLSHTDSDAIASVIALR